jgi:hypothetical protein
VSIADRLSICFIRSGPLTVARQDLRTQARRFHDDPQCLDPRALPTCSTNLEFDLAQSKNLPYKPVFSVGDTLCRVCLTEFASKIFDGALLVGWPVCCSGTTAPTSLRWSFRRGPLSGQPRIRRLAAWPSGCSDHLCEPRGSLSSQISVRHHSPS